MPARAGMTTMAVPKILVIPGSLRIASYNGKLAALAAKELALADADVTRISLADYPLPLFDAEMTAEVATPQYAVQLRRMVEAHQAVFMTSPEFSASVTPLIKNTIDWLSRPRARGEPAYEIFKDRVFAIGAASPGGDGGHAFADGAAANPRAWLRRAGHPRADHRCQRRRGVRRYGRSQGRKPCGFLESAGAPAGRAGAGDRMTAMQLEPRERLIVALDVPSVEAAQAMVARLGETVSFYKIGYQLAFAGGLAYAPALVAAGKRVFLDLKLHDIGNTVAEGVRSASRLGAAFLTVHAYPQTMKAAVEAREAGLHILAVTVLTSYNDADLAAAGYDFTVPELVAERAAQARDIGVDGLVCAAEEVHNVRAIVGEKVRLVTPGIRPAGAEAGDQKRIMTPSAAIAAGADYLVVGRPIVAAADPKAAAAAIVEEISRASR